MSLVVYPLTRRSWGLFEAVDRLEEDDPEATSEDYVAAMWGNGYRIREIDLGGRIMLPRTLTGREPLRYLVLLDRETGLFTIEMLAEE